jgi:hypothetical protein
MKWKHVSFIIVFQTGRPARARPEHDLARPNAARSLFRAGPCWAPGRTGGPGTALWPIFRAGPARRRGRPDGPWPDPALLRATHTDAACGRALPPTACGARGCNRWRRWTGPELRPPLSTAHADAASGAGGRGRSSGPRGRRRMQMRPELWPPRLAVQADAPGALVPAVGGAGGRRLMLEGGGAGGWRRRRLDWRETAAVWDSGGGGGGCNWAS